MRCPAPDELDDAFTPGEPLDPGRAAWVAEHVRECPSCRETFHARLVAFGDRTARPRPAPRPAGPRRSTILFLALGLGLVVASRLGPRPPRVRSSHAPAAVSSVTSH